MEGGHEAIGLIVVSGAMMLAAFLPTYLRLALLPAVVLELVFGVMIGPQVFDIGAEGPVLEALSEMGLAMLFLMAGLEIDPGEVKGKPMNLALKGWVLSVVIAAALGLAGGALGLFPLSGFLVLAISTTAIGALMPILRDQGLLQPPYGPFVLASGAVGEAMPLVALSLVLAGLAGLGLQGAILVFFAVTAAAAILLAGRLQQSTLPPVLRATMESSAQFPIRLALFLTLTFAMLGMALGLDLVLGAFVAGAVLRALLPHDLHDALMDRLSAVGYGFLVPIYFVTAGMDLDVAALAQAPTAILAVPLFVAMMLVVRGAPVFMLYRGTLEPRQMMALAFHNGTQLPLVVAISGLGVSSGAVPGWCGASLVIAAVLSVILFPMIAKRVLSDAKTDAGAAPGA